MALAVDIERGISDAWSTVASFVPRLLAFLVILVVGLVVAKALEKVVDKVLERVGFDRWVERGGVQRALAGSRYDASSILARLVYYTVVLFTLSTAFGVFGDNPISDYLGLVIAYLPKVFAAILLLVVAAAVAAAVRTLVQGSLGGLPYGRVLAAAASAAVLALGVVAALNQLEIAPEVVNAVLYAVLAAIVGVVVVAVGGGGIVPMRQRWERALARAEAEAPRVRAETRRTSAPAAPPEQPAVPGYTEPSSEDTTARISPFEATTQGLPADPLSAADTQRNPVQTPGATYGTPGYVPPQGGSTRAGHGDGPPRR